MERDTIFICHATPEDNEFVRWLGTRLTGNGYKVWADLFELKGGMPFWSTIDDTLRNKICKFIFVVSQRSVDRNRTGIQDELSVAGSIKKDLKDTGFIIPVKIDNTNFDELPIQVHRLNVIDFYRGWGSRLIELLDTLETAKVPRFTSDQTTEFEKWRATSVQNSTIVEIAPEPVLTNLVPVGHLEEPPPTAGFVVSSGRDRWNGGIGGSAGFLRSR